MAYDKVIFLDTETTGVDPSKCEIVSLAMYCPSNDTWLNQLFKTVEPIPAEASAVHHISNKDIEDSPTPSEADETVRFYLMATEAEIFVAHNASYDAEVMQRHFPWFDERFPEDSGIIDTLRWAKHVFPDAPNYRLQFLRYYLGLKTPIEATAHSASGDVEVLIKLYERLKLETGKIYTESPGPVPGFSFKDPFFPFSELIRQISKPLVVRKMYFGKHQWIDTQQIWDRDPKYVGWLTGMHWMPDEHPDLLFTFEQLKSGKRIDNIEPQFLS